MSVMPHSPIDPAVQLPVGCEARCPGCSHRLLGATASEMQKMAWLRRQLAPWAGRLQPLQTVAEAARWGYRRKVCLSAVWSEAAGWRFGLWRRDELIPIPDCPVHAGAVRALVRWLMRVLPPYPLCPLAFLVQSGAQATLVVKAHQVAAPDWLADGDGEELAASGLDGLWLHRHPAAGRRLFARNGWHLLWGQPRSRDAFGLLYGPTAFQQLIPELYRRALDTVESFLAPQAGDSLVDLYCGTGASLARWSARGARVIGVELGGEAVECARLNAPAVEILRGKCVERIPQLRDWAQQTGSRLLYVNPPRPGLEPEVLAWTLEGFRPDRLAYLSCSAGTLSRDLRALVAAGYAVDALHPYDFFPQTRHVETLALLRRIA
ncbi:MAG TPA: class I SAM-dependent RNA methyltransferase [Candidatus Competibacter sp.]|nr:class I SAM-dependent RNA methyltransferase [Candidatus Competibacter sp.]